MAEELFGWTREKLERFLRVERLVLSIGGPGVRVVGDTITIAPTGEREGVRAMPTEPYFAVIVKKGPKDEDDFPDERYWARPSLIDETDSETKQPAESGTHLTTSYSSAGIACATNLLELNLDKESSGISAYQKGTHLVPIGTHVVVHSGRDRRGKLRRYFSHPVSRVVVCQVTSAAAGDGVYNGRLLTGATSDFDPAGPAADDAFGDFPDGDDCWIVNMAEVGQTGHALTDGGNNVDVFIGVLRSRKRGGDAATDRHVVIINGFDTTSCDAGGSEAGYF